MNVATNDVVAAFRRVACADPRLTIVAQWDPRPVAVGGQRVALFYVQGFNFGLKSAVMAYNAVSELQTRAAPHCPRLYEPGLSECRCQGVRLISVLVQ